MARHSASSPNWISDAAYHFIDATGRVVGQIGHDLGDARSGCLEYEVVRVREVAVGGGDRYLGRLCDIGNGQRTAVRDEGLRGIHQRLPSALLLIRSDSHYEKSLLSCDISLIIIIIPYEVSALCRLCWSDV